MTMKLTLEKSDAWEAEARELIKGLTSKNDADGKMQIDKDDVVVGVPSTTSDALDAATVLEKSVKDILSSANAIAVAPDEELMSCLVVVRDAVKWMKSTPRVRRLRDVENLVQRGRHHLNITSERGLVISEALKLIIDDLAKVVSDLRSWVERARASSKGSEP